MNIVSLDDFKDKLLKKAEKESCYVGGGGLLKVLHQKRANLVAEYVDCTDDEEKAIILERINDIDQRIIPLEASTW